MLLLGGPLLSEGLRQLRIGRLSQEILLCLGVAAAFGYSCFSLWSGDEHVYFETCCMILAAFTIGRWLEATGKQRAADAVRSLARFAPTTVSRITADGPVETPLASIVAGDLIRIPAGQRIACDGVVRNGATHVDESLLTGESEPIAKTEGDVVFAGTLNVDGVISVSASAAASEGSLQRIVRLVERALEAKTKQQALADRVAAWFTPVVCGTSLLAAGRVWMDGGPPHDALLTALAVLLIACPCAFAVAVPAAAWTALGRAANRQVFFRGGDVISALATIRIVCFDKTGTLTESDVELTGVAIDEEIEITEVWLRAAALATASPHPLAAAIVRESSTKSGIPYDAQLDGLALHSGRGVEGTFDGATTLLGSMSWLRQCGLQSPSVIESEVAAAVERGESTTAVGWGGRIRGLFRFRERLRPQASQVVRRLQTSGCNVYVLTGDHSVRAGLLAKYLGTPVFAEMKPEDKLEKIAALRETSSGVLMVGDGVNDAPALAAADVGAALGGGADAARDAAGVCLVRSDLISIPWVIQLAKQTVRVMHQNLFWAFAYNVIGVALAAAGYLNPVFAAFAMVGSSLFVVGNSLRLGAFPDPKAMTVNDEISVAESEATPLSAAPPEVVLDAVGNHG